MTKTPKRPRDPSQLAKLIVDIATGEAKEPDVINRGSPGGQRRAEVLTKDKRVEIAKKGAAARWEQNGTSKVNETD